MNIGAQNLFDILGVTSMRSRRSIRSSDASLTICQATITMKIQTRNLKSPPERSRRLSLGPPSVTRPTPLRRPNTHKQPESVVAEAVVEQAPVGTKTVCVPVIPSLSCQLRHHAHLFMI